MLLRMDVDEPLLAIDDSSPTIRYLPYADSYGPIPNLSLGWNSYYTDSGFSRESGQVGNGTSYHVTSLEGAELTVAWTGTQVTLYGFVQSATFDIILDGESTAVQTGDPTILAQFSGLAFGPHSISLLVHPSGPTNASRVYFDRANVDFLPSNASMNFTADVINSTELIFSGAWSPEALTLTGEPDAVVISNEAGAQAHLSFDGPAIQISGIVTNTSGIYNVTVDSLSYQFNGSSLWTVDTTLFYQTGIPGSAPHQLTITNVDGTSLIVGSITIAAQPAESPSTSSPSSMASNAPTGLPEGTVIALIVAGIISFLAVLFCSFCLWRYYRHRPKWDTDDKSHTNTSIVDMPPPPPPPLPLKHNTVPIEYPRPTFAVPRSESSAGAASITSTPGNSILAPQPRWPNIPVLRNMRSRDGSTSSRSLSRRSYLRSINSLRQQYLYDERDRDDVHINSPQSEVAFRRTDAERDGNEDLDVDTVFAALSRHPQTPGLDPLSFLEISSVSASSASAQTRSMRSARMRSGVTSITGTDASIPYFSPAPPPGRRNDLRSSFQSIAKSLSFPVLNSNARRPTSRASDRQSEMSPPFELTPSPPRSNGQTGIIRMSMALDTPLKSPTDSVPRSISPFSPKHEQNTSLHSFSHSHSEKFYSAASNRQSSGSGERTGTLNSSGPSQVRPASPVPSSLNIRPTSNDVVAALLDPPIPAMPLPAIPLPVVPLSALASPLPHPFAAVAAPSVAEPSSPQPRPSSVPAWPPPTQTQSERVLRKLLGTNPSDSKSS